MAVDLLKFGSCTVSNVVDKSTVSVKSFWDGTPCVIALLRRFGCAFCRLHALELSRFQSAFQAKGVRLIGIGHDTEGVEEFREGQFFSGELYLDEKKETYAVLGCGSVGLVPGMFSLIQSAGRNLIRETKGKNVVGNLKGDGWQTGGLVVVDKDGSLLYFFKQTKVTDNPDYVKIKELFNLKEEDLAPLKGNQPKAVCN
ncbi:hypothetical protein EGR_01663 [Echinococcus granulosus]|uniref:Prostamide/prostaglandin F synthase n=1 Tax=Echinococcus granulosus TaxID=6210 RepID=W6USF9_ECHGR|nr:hypothetical protein EGR_01663 [Echinococcus granulosus]EUB63581.1 hypothetical protein EGR_01663 [Echinococcus granulosus]